MQQISVIWLRVAAALYSLGLLHAILFAFRRSSRLFRVALAAFVVGSVLHLVSIVEETILIGRFPANNFYESISLCGLLIAVAFLAVYWRYRYESLSNFIFPLVFVMTLAGALGNPVGPWSHPEVRDAWLLVHVVLVLLGYAALLLTAVAALIYLVQERSLKSKSPRPFTDRLPPLAALDDLISKCMALGFIFITASVVAGSLWAFVETGTRWITDPRVGVSLLTWFFYLVMVFLRVTAGWRGRRAAFMILLVVGFSAVTWAAHSSLRALLLP
jgi:ABC-type uncharacterized transport system permease subunit